MVTTRSMARALATDRLSELSDDLLLTHILSKLSYGDVVRSSPLSKQWQFLWKKVPFLHFCCQDFEKQKDDKIHAIIDNALLSQEAHIKSLDLKIALDDPKSADINKWILLAAQKQVKRIALEISYRDPETGNRLNHFSMVDLGDSIFKCESLTTLELRSINLPSIPTDFGVFQSLKTFYCDNNPNMDDATFEAFMDLCPYLQNLVILACTGLKKLKIHASNLMYLHLGLLRPDISLQVACPRLTKIKLIDCGHCQGLRLLQQISGAESVKIITLQKYMAVNEGNPVLPSITVLNGFPQLEELTMHGQCFQEMISDEEIVRAEVTLSNLKRVHAHIGPDKGEQAVTFLGFLLRNSPLSVMRVFLPEDCSGVMRNRLLDLEKEFSKSRLSTFTRRWSMDSKQVCQR